MPRVPPFDRPATYEDLVALDEIFDRGDHRRRVVTGRRRLPPRHSRASTKLGLTLDAAGSYRATSSSGWWILRAARDFTSANDVRRARRGRVAPPSDAAAVPEGRLLLGCARLGVRGAVAGHSAALDRAKKLAIYARERVEHAWLDRPRRADAGGAAPRERPVDNPWRCTRAATSSAPSPSPRSTSSCRRSGPTDMPPRDARGRLPERD